MRSTIVLSVLLFFIAGCATFKQLEPKPELSPVERGFIELKNDAENFKLDQGKQYFIKFPRPLRDNFALVIATTQKHAIRSYLTRAFDDGKEPITRIPDEAAPHDSLSVYAIDTSAAVFYWVVDSVRHNIELGMRYRYVPRWRYTFETKYAGFKSLLAANLVDRSTYLSSPGAPAIDALDFGKEIAALTDRTKRVSAMNQELIGVAGLFPPDIASTRDTAYQNYRALRSEVEDELQFQENYAAALNIFRKERGTWGNTAAFLSEAGGFADFLNQRDRYPAPILDKARKAFQGRLGDAVPHYEKQLLKKRDVKPIVAAPPLEPVEKLFRALGRGVPAEFEDLRGYISRFNIEANALQSVREKLRGLVSLIDKATASPPPAFYAELAGAAQEARSGLPQAAAVAADRYRSVEAGAMLALELGKTGEQADDLRGLGLASEKVATDIGAGNWQSAEAGTRQLSEGREGITFASASRYRDKFVSWFEADIFAGVLRATQTRLDGFVRLHEATIQDVPKLYADSAFMPAYQLTFSAGGQAALARKLSQIEESITKVRNYQFPEAAMKTIYKDFSRDLNAAGVDRARAIVDHGKMYKGSDKQLSAIISECDPTVAKWIVRPKEYRRILALPVTSNRRGTNEYMFRVRLQIPSEAQFPVFDINIKLPKDLAEGARREQWYDAITINKTPIKNEGRFRITAPTEENDYESQISPVQMDKEGANVLEVRFTKASYRVYEISAMAQVPIMKKN